jgi:methyl-accepting chemotaxis protein
MSSRTPSQRLKAFFDSTTLSVREFAKEIGNEQKYRTLYDVFNGKRDPSSKLVKTIIRRFPQLSYDWVFVGAGEMLTEGGDMMRSVHDHELSVQARFVQTMDRIDKIEFSINELANRIERAMSHQAEMTNIFFTKIDSMTNSHKKMIDGANELHDDIKNTQKIVQRLEDTDHKLTEEVSIALKASTEISKKIMWNREQAAAEVAEMKIIALKILDSHNSNQKP